MFSESELVFLAFVFIATLGCLMLGRRRTDSPPVRRPNKKKHKRVKCKHCCLNGWNKNGQKKTMTTKLITVVAHYSGRIIKVTCNELRHILMHKWGYGHPSLLSKFELLSAVIFINWSLKT